MSDLIVIVSEKNFQSEVMQSATPVIIDFWADWCGPCVALAPILEAAAQELSGKVKICKVNIEESPQLAAQFNVRNIPFLAFIKDGQKVGDLVGNQPKAQIVKKAETVFMV